MAKTHEDLEGYLNRLERHFERHEDGTYLVAVPGSQVAVALRLAPPVLVLQVEIGPAPKGEPAAEARVFRHLLQLNATDLLHASYGVEGDSILLSAALELDNLDLNEIEAALADVSLALSNHVPVLREMAQQKG